MGKRIFYYAIGIIIGIILVKLMFGSRDDIKFDWLPNDRTIKMLRAQEFSTNSISDCQLNCLQLKPEDVDSILSLAEVDFSASKVRDVACKLYVLESEMNQRKYLLSMEVCDTIPELKMISSDQNCPCE